jgi:hypothetical protein
MADVDTRNLDWKDNNVGSKLLQKMGWKDGQSIGKRRLLKAESDVSSEGMRVKKRAVGLGLGATTQTVRRSVSHTADFVHVLNSLQEEHAVPERKKDKRKKSKDKKSLVLPTNKSTHAKVRAAKFQEKSADDMKCIFGGVDIFASISAEASQNKKRKKDDSDQPEKKKKKKDKSKKEKN